MKKLIIAGAVALAAALSHGATASWGFSGISATEKSAAAAGWVGYLMAADTWDTFSALADGAKADFVTANNLASATTVNARGVINLTASGYGSFSAGDTFEAYSVIFSGASAASADYIAYSAVKSATVNAAGSNISISDTFANLTASSAGGSGGWVAVPEPTSGLLMLLGMAGLALRRRRA